MRRFSVSLVAGLIFASLLTIPMSAGPVAAAPEGAPDYGAQFHAMWSDYTDAERMKVLDKLQAAGIKWIRMDFGWSSVQPTDGNSYATWYLERADRIIDGARARGIKVLMGFGRTPGWANGGQGPNVPPTNPNTYGNAAEYLARYFKGRVSAWGVYNEPNHKNGSFWTGTAADYAKLLKASYSRFHIGDPNTKVVVAHTVYNDDVWIRDMYKGGAQGYFDVLATHPYQGVADDPPEAPDNGTKWRLTHIPAVRKVMCDFGDCSKKIWFTEFGWSSHANDGTEGNWERGVTAAQQADYAVRTAELVRERYPYVTKIFWYNERNKDKGSLQHDNYGILNRDLTNKPIYGALKTYLTSGETTPEPSPSPTPEETVSPTPEETVSPTPEETVSPTPEESPSPTPEPGSKRRNLIKNGSFEGGKSGWQTKKSSLRIADVAYEGERAGKVVPKRRSLRLISNGAAVSPERQKVDVRGVIKGRRVGQLVKVVVREMVNGRMVGRKLMRFRVRSLKWQSFPEMSVKTTGRKDAQLSVRVRSGRKATRALLVDHVRVLGY